MSTIKFKRNTLLMGFKVLFLLLFLPLLLLAQPIKTTCTFDLVQSEGIRIFSSINNNAKWPTNARIRVMLLENPRGSSLTAPQVRNIITEATQEWSSHCGIRFEFVNTLPADVRITFRSGYGNNALLGTNTINGSRNFDTNRFETNSTGSNVNFDFPGFYTEREVKATVLHEFGHVLGLIHEHLRPDNGIPWDTVAVFRFFSGEPNNWSRERIRRNILTPYNERDVSNCGEPDRLSIMHYRISNELTIGDFEVEQNLNLSQQDKDCINEYYPSARLRIIPPVLDPAVFFREITIVSKRGNPKFEKLFKEITISYSVNNSCVVEQFKIDGINSYKTSLSIPKNADNIEINSKVSTEVLSMTKSMRRPCSGNVLKMPIPKSGSNKSVKVVIKDLCPNFQ